MKESSPDFLLLANYNHHFWLSFLDYYLQGRKLKNPLNAIIIASEAVANGNNNIRLEIKPNLLG